MPFTKPELVEFTKVVAALCETFGRAPSEATYRGYQMGLDDLPLQTIANAARRAMRESRRMPTVAELRELAGERSAEAEALLAWDAFQRAVARHGYYGSVDFQDKTINAVVRSLGGWAYVSCIEGADEFYNWLRQRFLAAYKALAGGRLSPEAAAPLIGEHAKNNRDIDRELAARLEARGSSLGSPVLIPCESGRRAGQLPPASPVPTLSIERPALVLKKP